MTARPHPTARQSTSATASHRTPVRPQPRSTYRLLHSSGDHLITDRRTAIARLAALPGAKLFVLQSVAG